MLEIIKVRMCLCARCTMTLSLKAKNEPKVSAAIERGKKSCYGKRDQGS